MHHRCITSTEFGGLPQDRGRRKTEWLSQIGRPDDSWAEESGLQGLLVEGAILHLKADLEWLELIEQRLKLTEERG